ncbi:TolC family protein [Ferruginibacter paludis]|uniref:TolC family protein n=1 Tax=Ferruginibacter paludis TaxID=1310417 RepID=UPI0025B48FEF|nr:TolC family protein [Ferruginibacter paludis]MDN3658998.1 TolC family protein [Ferruginibacter paludis]
MKYKFFILLHLFIFQLFGSSITAQAQTDTSIHLTDALRLGKENYHLLKSKKLEIDAANKYVDVIKYSRLPTIDASYQAGFGTANNLTGIFYPNGILPISGPPSINNNFNPATGSAASILLNWQAVTFGQRDAQINVSIAETNTKKTEWQQALFLHKINIISIYLDVVLAAEKIKILQQNIDRVNVNLKQSRVLAITGIKPGVDTTLFLSEFSKATIELMNAQRQLQVTQLQMAQLMVTDALPVPADTFLVNKLPTFTIAASVSLDTVPVIQLGKSQLLLSQSKELLLKKSFLPKLNVWGTGFARGSGFQPDGSIKTWDGLGLNRFNYSGGVQLIFPIMKYGEVKKQLMQQNLLSKATQEKIEESKSILTMQQRIANTTFNNTIAVANETQKQLKSARYAFTAMQTRYNTGLVNFADLIQAQYNLLKAELDGKTAYWDAWKALLLQTAVLGDENIFLKATR